jgi:HAD superfamily hydrolase (TIGR01509 family)
MPLRAVFFDLDGVLIDSFEAACATMNDAAYQRGLQPIAKPTLRTVFGQSSERDVEMFFPGWSADELDAFYAAHFPKHLDLVQPMPGAKSVIDALDDNGIPTAVITNSPSNLARDILERFDIIPHALVGAGDGFRPKPAPDIIFRACEVLDVEPWDVLIVGDTEYDKRAAAAAGAPFAGIHGIAGNFTIEHLDEVPAILSGTFR